MLMDTETQPQWRLQDRLARSLDFGDVSVAAMAATLRVSRNTVGNYLAGRTHPTHATIVVWARVCRVPIDWLVGDEGGDAVTDAVTLWEQFMWESLTESELELAAAS